MEPSTVTTTGSAGMAPSRQNRKSSTASNVQLKYAYRNINISRDRSVFDAAPRAACAAGSFRTSERTTGASAGDAERSACQLVCGRGESRYLAAMADELEPFISTVSLSDRYRRASVHRHFVSCWSRVGRCRKRCPFRSRCRSGHLCFSSSERFGERLSADAPGLQGRHCQRNWNPA